MGSKFRHISKIGFIVTGCLMALMMLFSGIDGLVNPDDRPKSEKLDLDNFSLETLTDEQIVLIEKQYKAYRYNSSKKGGDTDVDNFRYEDYDRDKLSFSAKKITGIHPIQATKVTDGTLRVNIETKLNSGEMKIVVIRDDEILEYLEVGRPLELNYSAEGEHTYYIKLLCKEANMSVTVTREIQ